MRRELGPYLLFALLLLSAMHAHSQQGFVRGYLLDSITHFPVTDGTVSGGKLPARTDAKGFFIKEATPGELLYVAAKGYHPDTVRYSVFTADTITLYLSPLGNVLETVTVRSGWNRYQLDSIERRSTFELMQGQTLGTVAKSRSQGFGLILNLDRVFKQKYRNRKREEELFRNTEDQAYIRYRFSPHLVAYYTGMKGEALRDFLYRYTPDTAWLRAHQSHEEVVYYISDKLKAYRASKNK